MVQCESITSFFQRTDRDGGTALFSSMAIPFRRYSAPFDAIPHGSGMTSASTCKDCSLSRTEGDPRNVGNGVYSTIPPQKLARMGMSPPIAPP